jgi:uncharacterized protein involved in outer membrane biogenesis
VKRLAILVGAGTLLVAAVLGTFMALNLRAFVDAHRDELVARGERMLERPLAVGAVEPAWWPLGIRFRDVTIDEDPRFGATPFLEAAAVRIAVRLWPLARGRIELAGMMVDRPRVTLVRDQRRRWNVASLGTAAAPPAPAGERGGGRRRGPRLPLEWVVGVPRIEMRDGRVELEDRGGAAPRRASAERVRLRAEDVRFGGAARLRLDAALFGERRHPDAHVDLRVARLGEQDARHASFTATAALADADLGAVAAWLGGGAGFAGRLATASAEVSGTLERLRVAFQARGGDGPLRLGRHLVLPAVPRRLAARVRYEDGVVTLDEASTDLAALALRARGALHLEPWGGSLEVWTADAGTLALAVAEPPLELGDLEAALSFAPGRARLDSSTLHLDGLPFTLAGEVRALDPLVLDGRFEGRAFDGSLAGSVVLAPGGRLEVRGRVAAVDLGAAVARFAPEASGRVAGRADGTLALALELGAAVPRDTLAGSGALTVAGGRLKRLNVAERILGSGRVELLPRLVPARARARYPAIFDAHDTVLTAASLPFTIGGGRVAAERVRLEGEPYAITGAGWIDRKRQVRFDGDLVLSAALSAALREDVRAVRYLLDADERVTVPFRVRGTLGHARFEPDAKRLRARGLEILRQARDEPAEVRAPRDPKRRSPRPPDVEQAEEAVLDRLDRMLRP